MTSDDDECQSRRGRAFQAGAIEGTVLSGGMSRVAVVAISHALTGLERQVWRARERVFRLATTLAQPFRMVLALTEPVASHAFGTPYKRSVRQAAGFS